MIRVLLVDDHAVVRQGVERLLESGADMVVVGQAADADEALALAAATEADVCILDLGIAGGGPDLVAQIREDVSTSRAVLSRTPPPISFFEPPELEPAACP